MKNFTSKTLATLALASTLFVSACPNIGITVQDSSKALITTCATYAGALEVLSPLRQHGQLSARVVVTVNNTIRVVSPICNNDLPLPGNPGDALAYVKPLIDQLVTFTKGASL